MKLEQYKQFDRRDTSHWIDYIFIQAVHDNEDERVLSDEEKSYIKTKMRKLFKATESELYALLTYIITVS